MKHGLDKTTEAISFAGATVLRLLGKCRPSTVARLIVAVIVDAVQRRPFGASPHVRQKRFERSSPSLAHFNPTATVVCVCDMRRVFASLLHGRPGVVFPRRVVARMISVNRVPCRNKLSLQASAASTDSVQKLAAFDTSNCSAAASAFPQGASPLCRAISRNDDPSPKRLAGDVYGMPHKSNDIPISGNWSIARKVKERP